MRKGGAGILINYHECMCQGSGRRTINSKKLEHGLRMIRAGIPFSIPFGVWGLGCSNCWSLLCSAVHHWEDMMLSSLPIDRRAVCFALFSLNSFEA